jgi:GTPase SAR1 family protein
MTARLLRIYTLALANPALTISILALMLGALNFLFTHLGRIQNALELILGRWLGRSEARYRSKYLDLYLKVTNIYLDEREVLDIASTYVPLQVFEGTQGGQGRVPARDILVSTARTRVLLLGDPGSGKTFLMKSFGNSLLTIDYRRRGHDTVDRVPIYIELRDFAARRADHDDLPGYIAKQVMEAQFGLPSGEAFLKDLLRARRCVVLLDGLDEVAQIDYQYVRGAVHEFMSRYVPDKPSEVTGPSVAQLVMTSRAQNFLTVIDDWLPSAFRNYHVLAPFSDSDIQLFLQKRATDLPTGKTPAALLHEIVSSGTLDLHRTPLILTVSLALYKYSPRYSIPDSISLFYRAITTLLLKRHDFPQGHHTEKLFNKFTADQKFQYLRLVALSLAKASDRFDDFSYDDLSEAFRIYCKTSPQVRIMDRASFLSEIIEHAGLISKIGASGRFVFAHRSFHEYFAATQLALNAQRGVDEALARATDQLWRQIVIFLASLDHECHDQLLNGLSKANAELAGYCLGVASKFSHDVGLMVIRQLDAVADQSNAVSLLGALCTICRHSTDDTMRDAAMALIVRMLHNVLTREQEAREQQARDQRTRAQADYGKQLDLGRGTPSLVQIRPSAALAHDVHALWGLTRDDLVRLVGSLSVLEVEGAEEACARLSLLVEDEEPRFVSSLWTCFVRLMHREAEGGRSLSFRRDVPKVVSRLLDLVQSEEGFRLLGGCAPLDRSMTPGDPPGVFPFPLHGTSSENLVSLLLVADKFLVIPDRKNGYLMAFSQRRKLVSEWRNLRQEVNKRAITFKPFVLGIGLALGYLASLVLFVVRYKQLGWKTFSFRYSMSLSTAETQTLGFIGFGIVLTVAVCLAQGWLARAGLGLAVARSREYAIVGFTGPKSTPTHPPANPVVYLLDRHFNWLRDDGVPYWTASCFWPLCVCGVAQAPLLCLAIDLVPTWGSAGQLAIGALLSLVLFWLPAHRAFLPSASFDLRRRGSLATLIAGDPSSELWIRGS